MTTYTYTRVSTGTQDESLDVQKRQTEAYCVLHDLTVDYAYVDRAISGGMPFKDRPAGKKLLGIVQEGDSIIAAKLDRMFRSSLDALSILEILREQKVSLHLIDMGGDVTGNGIAKLVFTILSAVAEAERDRIRERIRDVKRNQRRLGMHLGGPRPFGYQIVDRMLTPHPDEYPHLVKLLDLHNQGSTLREIAEIISSDGMPISFQKAARAIQYASHAKV